MQKNFIVIAALLAAVAVVLGAFGAHGLKAKLTPDQLQVFETGVKYQFYHAMGLFLLGLLLQQYNNTLLVYAGFAFMVGILLFSGSLYLLANKTLLGIEGWRWLGPVTPLGGLSFIVGWLLLAAGLWRS